MTQGVNKDWPGRPGYTNAYVTAYFATRQPGIHLDTARWLAEHFSLTTADARAYGNRALRAQMDLMGIGGEAAVPSLPAWMQAFGVGRVVAIHPREGEVVARREDTAQRANAIWKQTLAEYEALLAGQVQPQPVALPGKVVAEEPRAVPAVAQGERVAAFDADRLDVDQHAARGITDEAGLRKRRPRRRRSPQPAALTPRRQIAIRSQRTPDRPRRGNSSTRTRRWARSDPRRG